MTPNLSDSQPLQIVFPSGNCGIGIPFVPQLNENDIQRNDVAIVASNPENLDEDRNYRRGVCLIFLCVALVNLIITCLLFANADVVDSSKV